jgi:hypothetical protein
VAFDERASKQAAGSTAVRAGLDFLVYEFDDPGRRAV